MDNVQNIPFWFRRDGLEMKPGGIPIYNTFQKHQVLVGSKFAQLQITRALDRGIYKVSYSIIFSCDECARIDIRLTIPELENAFALSERPPIGSVTATMYQADVSIPGRYTRTGRYLNLPMPGTGMDRDLNLSVFVTDEIQALVRKLLSETD